MCLRTELAKADRYLSMYVGAERRKKKGKGKGRVREGEGRGRKGKQERDKREILAVSGSAYYPGYIINSR